MNLQVRPTEWAIRIDEPDSALQNLTVRDTRVDVDEQSLKSSVEAFTAVVRATERALSQLNLGRSSSAKDCIEIMTEAGTTIRINCPIITLGTPTIS